MAKTKRTRAKIKPLLPTQREKKRYVKFQILSENKIDERLVGGALKRGIQRYMGISGMAKAGIILMQDQYDTKAQTGVIRVGHKHVNELKSALLFITKIGKTKEIGEPVIVKSITTSGILKKAQRRM